MARQKKIYKIRQTQRDREYFQVGTIEELVQAYAYTLEVGESWQDEKGNKKINRNPKSIKVLVKNLYNAKNNSAANGYSGCYFEEVPVTDEDREKYLKQL
jgi:hypothetical protein